MPYSSSDLAILDLEQQDLDHLSHEEQTSKLRRQWYLLSRRYHPDRNPGHEERFHAVTEAYNRLIAGEPSLYEHEITPYYTAEEVVIPQTAFDLTHQEGIQLTHEALLRQFSTLRTEDAKKRFATYYAPFLNLATSLERQQSTLNHRRPQLFFEQSQENFWQRFLRDWRISMLKIFGEEYLDDFLYRQALSTGDLWPILATRKYCNVLKWLIAIFNSLSLFGIHAASYLLEVITLRVFLEFHREYSAQQRNVHALAISVAKIIAIGVACVLPFYVIPNIAYYLFSLSFLVRVLEVIASPVSQYVRPVSARLGCSEKMLSLLSMLGGSLLATTCVLNMSMFLAALPTVLSVLNIFTILYMMYACVKLIRLMYELQPALAILQVILFAVAILIQILFPLPTSMTEPTLKNLFGAVLLNLSTCAILDLANTKLEDMSAYQAELMEILPLPEEPVSSQLQTACLLGYNKASWSHRLFQTPKDAPSISLEKARARNSIWTCLWGSARPEQKDVYFEENTLRVEM